jgi:hypothetical protein
VTKFQIACLAVVATLERAQFSVDAYLAANRGDIEEMIDCQARESAAGGRLDQLSIEWRFS